MSTLGRYCKAYPIALFREFPGWSEPPGFVIKADIENDEGEHHEGRLLSEHDYLFLQDNLTVTAGVFLDDDVIFSAITPEWKEYCHTTLKFAIPNAT